MNANHKRRGESIGKLIATGALATLVGGLALAWLNPVLGPNEAAPDSGSQGSQSAEVDDSQPTPEAVERVEPVLTQWVGLEPDGSAEFVISTNPNGDFDVLRISETGEASELLNRLFDDLEPALSPDGTNIAFTSNTEGTTAIYIVEAGSDEAPVRLSPTAVQAREPTWSPDGQSIAYTALIDGSWDILVHDLDSPTSRVVASTASNERSPAWSPNGAFLAFRSDRSGNGDIYSYDFASLGVRQVTSSSHQDDEPSWSIEGQIAFERILDGDKEIFVVDHTLDGSQPRRLTFRSGFDGLPAFAGNVLFYVKRDGSANAIVSWLHPDEPIYETAGHIQELLGLHS